MSEGSCVINDGPYWCEDADKDIPLVTCPKIELTSATITSVGFDREGNHYWAAGPCICLNENIEYFFKWNRCKENELLCMNKRVPVCGLISDNFQQYINAESACLDGAEGYFYGFCISNKG